MSQSALNVLIKLNLPWQSGKLAIRLVHPVDRRIILAKLKKSNGSITFHLVWLAGNEAPDVPGRSIASAFPTGRSCLFCGTCARPMKLVCRAFSDAAYAMNGSWLREACRPGRPPLLIFLLGGPQEPAGAGNSVTSCDLLISVDEAAEPVLRPTEGSRLACSRTVSHPRSAHR